MPGKLEIMHAIREGLDSLKGKVNRTASSTEWSSAVKTELCRIGQCQFLCKVGARTNEVDEAHRDYGEWLYDVTWLEYGPDGRLVDAHLVAECEWSHFGEIDEDFQKLLLAHAGVRLMVFDGNPKCGNDFWPGSEEVARRLAERVRDFNGSRLDDAWLLAAWEKTDARGKAETQEEYDRAWRFRYFTIETKTAAIAHPFPGE